MTLTTSATQGCLSCRVELPRDLFFMITSECFHKRDYASLLKLASLSKYHFSSIGNFIENLNLKQLCPQMTILNAKVISETLKIEINDEPRISPLAILKSYESMAPHVEADAGVTLLTLWKGLNLNQMIEIAAKEGMKVRIWNDQILIEQGTASIQQTCIIMIANNVFKDTRDKRYAAQKDLIETKHGFELPAMLDSVTLCVLTRIKTKGAICLFGQNPLTYGRTSTHVEGHPLSVGGSAPARLLVSDGIVDGEIFGAGARRKF